MDDACFVGSFECVDDLSGDGQRFVDGDRPLRDAIGERRPIDQFQDQGARAGLCRAWP